MSTKGEETPPSREVEVGLLSGEEEACECRYGKENAGYDRCGKESFLKSSAGVSCAHLVLPENRTESGFRTLEEHPAYDEE